MVTPTKAQVAKGAKNQNMSGSTVEATPTPTKSRDDLKTKATVFEPRATRNTAPVPVEQPTKSKKTEPIIVKKSQIAEHSKEKSKTKESGKTSKVNSISPRKGCQNELRRLLENNLPEAGVKEKRGGLRDEFDPSNRRKQAKVSQMQKRNVRGPAPVVKKHIKTSPARQEKKASPFKLIAKKVEKSISPPKRQYEKKEEKKSVKKLDVKEDKKAKK